MGEREKRHIITGGLILIALGVLILLSTLGIYNFDRSWPVLLIVIAFSVLIQNPKGFEGWFIGIVGVVFLILKNGFDKLGEMMTNVVVSVLIIGIGAYLLWKKKV
jgi:hypothetical protein